MKKTTRNILLVGSGIAAVGAAAGAASYALTKYLVKVALDREQPQNIRDMDKATEILTGSAQFADFLHIAEECEEKLRNSGCETVKLICRSGETLVGHWHHCESAARTIIAMHGWRTSWAHDFALASDFWHENHCNVLYVEQRGQNNSGGDYMGFGLLERYDCLDWVNWVNERCGCELPIYLAGVSMGASTVLMSAGLELPDNVHGILADCGFTSPHAIWKHVAENNLHLRYDYRAGMIDDLCRQRLQVSASEYSTIDAMRICKVPVLFVHGTDDHFVPVEMTFENYKACTAPKRLFVVPGADHGMSYYIDRTGYEAAVKSFWSDYDYPGDSPDEDNMSP